MSAGADEQEPVASAARETIIGHDAQERRLRRLMDGPRLHHAWLFVGPRGIGKTTMAFRFARALLDPDGLAGAEGLQMDPARPVFRQIAAGAHPDLKVISRPWDEKRKKFKSELPVDEVRALNMFFTRTAGAGGRRVAIVDCIDDMNRNAANALLKTLEEPPDNGVLVLICHSGGRALRTIRSRCAQLRFHPLSDDQMKAFLAEECPAGGTDALIDAASGAPGAALAMLGADIAALRRDADAYIDAALDGHWRDLRALIDRYAQAGSDLHAFWRMLTLSGLAERARKAVEAQDLPRARAFAEGRRALLRTLDEADALNLDIRHAMLDGAERMRRAEAGGRPC